MDKSLNHLKLDKRDKELDAREEYLAQREALLEEAPLSIKVLEATIAAKTKQLSVIQEKIVAADTAYDSHILLLRDKIDETEQEHEDVLVKIDKLLVTAKSLTSGNTKLRVKLTEVKQDIIDSNTYKLEQDILIAESINEGNLTLKSLKYEIEGLEEIKKTINFEIAMLTVNRNEAQGGLENLDQALIELQLNYDETNANLSASLESQKKNLREVSKQSQQITQDIKKKLASLHTQEVAVMAKLGAIKRERAELETEKRRFDSTKSLYSDIL